MARAMPAGIDDAQVVDVAAHGPGTHRTRRSSAGRGWVTTLSLLLLMIAWHGVTQAELVSDLFLPGPGLVWDAFIDLIQNGYKSRSLLEHATLSLSRVLQGFVLGSVAGT